MPTSRQDRISAVSAAMQAYQRSTDAFDDLVATHLGVNRTDLRCLDFLFGGPHAAGEVAQGVGVSTAAATSLIDRLESRQLVRRVRDPMDRRKVLVEMTDQGRRLTSAFYAPLAAEGNGILARYKASELQLLRDFLVAATELTERHRERLSNSRPSSGS